MDTPPGTTLSTPSPTDLQDRDPVAAEFEKVEMTRSSAYQKLKPIYIVVATTPCTVRSSSGNTTHRLGIGMNGSLPWPSIKADMQFFKNVTLGKSPSRQPQNTVIMGRKTYFSIPSRFRPLDQRENVIVTRSDIRTLAQQIKDELHQQSTQARDTVEKKYGIDWQDKREELKASVMPLDKKKLVAALSDFEIEDSNNGSLMVAESNSGTTLVTIEESPNAAVSHKDWLLSGELFCIGGAEIYKAFMDDNELRPRLRILQTEIEKLSTDQEFQCDTFWSENLQDPSSGWQEADLQEIVAWTGVEPPQQASTWYEDSQAGVRIRVRGWQYVAA